METTSTRIPPVQLKWRDFIASLQNLLAREDCKKVDEHVQMLFLGWNAMMQGRSVCDRLMTTEVEMENLRPYMQSKSRAFSSAVSLICSWLLKDESSVALQIPEWSANALSSLVTSEDLQRDMPCLPALVYSTILPSLQEATQHARLISDESKLKLCKTIDFVEAWEAEVLNAHSSSSTYSFLKQHTSDKNTLVVMLFKFAQLNNPSDLLSLLLSCSTPPTSPLVHTLLDFLLQTRTSLPWELSCACVSSLLGVAHSFPPAEGSMFLRSVGELLLSVSRAKPQSDTTVFSKILSSLIPQLLQVTSAFLSSAPGLSSSLCDVVVQCLDVLCVCAENDIDVFVMWAMLEKHYFYLAARTSTESRELVLKRALSYAYVAAQTFKALPMLTSVMASISTYFDRCGCPSLILEGGAVSLVLELATQFALPTIVDPPSLCNFFERELPSSTMEVTLWDISEEDRCSLLHSVLKLGYACVRRGINRMKAFVFFLPSLYARITQLPWPRSDTERAHILRAILQLSLESVQRASDVSILLAEGFPVALEVMQERSGFESKEEETEGKPAKGKKKGGSKNKEEVDPLGSSEELTLLTAMLTNLAEKFEMNGGYNLVLSLKYSYDFLRQHFKQEQTSRLFRSILRRGDRQKVKLVHQVCVQDLLSPTYSSLRGFLMGEKGRVLSTREFEGLCVLLGESIRLTKDGHPAVLPIVTDILSKIESELSAQSLSKGRIHHYTQELSRVYLFKTLFKEELDGMKELTVDALVSVFSSKFPSDVLGDEETMEALSVLGRRLEHMQEKYSHLRAHVTKCMEVLLQPSSPLSELREVSERAGALRSYLLSLPQNETLIQHLQSCGYSADLLCQDVTMRVEVEDKRNPDEWLRSQLLALYSACTELLQLLNIRSVVVEGRAVESSQLFLYESNLMREELRVRKEAAIAAINDAMGKLKDRSFYASRLLELEQKERALEAEWDKQVQSQQWSPAKTKRYCLRLHRSFLRSVVSCGSNIVGCYAPDGDHCEKPIENGMKVNAALVSLYEEGEEAGAGNTKTALTEIENLEVLLTDQGLFVFKLYSNGHPHDTSVAWACFFRSLLLSHYVPSIILPRGFPNPRTFSLVSASVAEEYACSLITFRDDFFAEDGVNSYYDMRPEQIKPGDILLTLENINSLLLPSHSLPSASSPSSPLLKSSSELKAASPSRARRHLRPVKDLAGTIVSAVMTESSQGNLPSGSASLVESVTTSHAPAKTQLQVNVLGRFLTEYVTKLLEKGEKDPSILQVGFDVELWNRRRLTSERMSEADKNSLVSYALSRVDAQLSRYYSCDVELLYMASRMHFFDLKRHLEVLTRRKESASKSLPSSPSLLSHRAMLRKMCALLRSKVTVLSFSSLHLTSRIELMRIAFRNEERVWAQRGGRPEDETLPLFIQFVSPPSGNKKASGLLYDPAHYGHEPFGGLVLLSDPPHISERGVLVSLDPRQVIGYSIGDYIASDTFDVATAWVDERYRGAELATEMYSVLLKSVYARGARYMGFDMLLGGVGKVIRSHPVLNFLTMFGLDRIILQQRTFSYSSKVSGGKEEQFEKMLVVLPLLVPSMVLWDRVRGAPLKLLGTGPIGDKETEKRKENRSRAGIFIGVFASVTVATAGLLLFLRKRTP